MATKKSRRRSKKVAKKSARKKRRKSRKVRAVATTVAAPRRKKRRASKRRAAPRKKRRSRRVKAPTMVVAAPRKRRKSRRKSRRVKETVTAWRGNSAGHAKAARKGHRRRKAKSVRRKSRRRVRSVAAPQVVQASRRKTRRSSGRRRSRGMFEPKRNGGLGVGGLALMLGTGGLGFVLADGLDRLLATYNPSSTEAKPKDKFTSDGSGTLANTLNVASAPGWLRLVAGLGVTAVPTVGSMYVKNPLVRASLEGAAIGAGISTFKTLWNNVIMPLLLPKEDDTATLQKSYIARLYPAESAARINTRKKTAAGVERTPEQIEAARRVSSAGSGALSDPAPGVGAPSDVGPFALSGDSPYPDAGQALRQRAGVSGDSSYPDAATALRSGVSGDSPYPSADQALRGVGAPEWNPGPPPGAGPGPQAPATDASCACLGESNPFLGFVGDGEEKDVLFAGG